MTPADAGRDQSHDLTLVGIASVVARRRRLLLAIPLATALLALIVALVLPPTYTATATFVPESSTKSRLPEGLVGLVGQLGIPLDFDAARSPRFYADVLKSRALLERVLLLRYPDPRTPVATDSATLLDILETRGRDQGARLARGTRLFARRVGTQVHTQTNMVRVSVDLRHSALAAQVVSRMLQDLNDFNASTRQFQARERRKFVEQRLAASQDDLREVEQRLRAFYERNRSWQESPQLNFVEGQLRRQVEIRQQVYLTLNREYETARIEEVNDTPVITLIDPPVEPRERSKPKPLRVAVVAFVLGALLALTWAYVADYVEQVRRDSGRALRRL